MSQPSDDRVDESATPEPAAGSAKPPVVVKKYANRRLYNTESSSYITLDTLADMVRNGRDFVVYDAKTAEDITRSVLTQIIVEEESKGRALLPTAFLRQLIGFYGDSMQTLVPKYLENAMASFARQQESVRVAMQNTLGGFLPFGIEEVSRQNMAMMERAITLFSPFKPGDGEEAKSTTEAPATEPAAPTTQDREVAALRAEVEQLRRALAQSHATQPPPVPTAIAPSHVAPSPAEANGEGPNHAVSEHATPLIANAGAPPRKAENRAK
jgi:polyhydroxyalkanoate synthesis repressor PhaR